MWSGVLGDVEVSDEAVDVVDLEGVRRHGDWVAWSGDVGECERSGVPEVDEDAFGAAQRGFGWAGDGAAQHGCCVTEVGSCALH